MSLDPVASPPNASNAVTALVLGILGIVVCPLCGPFAWALGRKGEQEIDASGGAVGGRGMATAGKILGIVGTALMLLVIVSLILLLAVGAESE